MEIILQYLSLIPVFLLFVLPEITELCQILRKPVRLMKVVLSLPPSPITAPTSPHGCHSFRYPVSMGFLTHHWGSWLAHPEAKIIEVFGNRTRGRVENRCFLYNVQKISWQSVNIGRMKNLIVYPSLALRSDHSEGLSLSLTAARPHWTLNLDKAAWLTATYHKKMWVSEVDWDGWTME